MHEAITHLQASDPTLRQIIAAVGAYAIQYHKPHFPTLARSIVYQQLSGKAAATIFARLARQVGRLSPTSILRLSDDDMRQVGLSAQKAKYLRDLAEKTLRRQIRFQKLGVLPDEEVIEHLTQIKGVGVWTAQMYLIFALRRPDVLPVGDLGVRSAVERAYQLDHLPLPGEMLEIARPWRPWASVASWYLWRSLEGPAAL